MERWLIYQRKTEGILFVLSISMKMCRWRSGQCCQLVGMNFNSPSSALSKHLLLVKKMTSILIYHIFLCHVFKISCWIFFFSFFPFKYIYIYVYILQVVLTNIVVNDAVCFSMSYKNRHLVCYLSSTWHVY